MKNYTPPELTEYGDVAAITAIFGNAFTGDVLLDTNGDVVQEGNLSISADPCGAQTDDPNCG